MSKNTNFPIVKFAAFIFIIAVFLYFITIAKSFLIPLVFGLLFSFLLHPIRKFYKKKIKLEGLSIALSIITIILPMMIVILFFSLQLSEIISSLPSITNNIGEGLNKALDYITSVVPITQQQKDSFMTESINSLVSTPLNMVQNSVVSTTSVLVSISLTLLYTIFFLYYFKSFKNFVLYQVDDFQRPQVQEILVSIQQLTQKYLTGLGTVIIILASLNSLGLYIIGVKYAVFWGCLAGLLAIIPYIGTLLGGTLPFLFAIATSGTIWQPVAVLIFYGFVQALEGNIITPKVVGDQVDINPLVALMAIILLGNLWGVSGIILSLPLIAMVRIIFEHINATKPLAILLGSDIYSEENLFKERYNADRYRLTSLFRSKKK